MEAVIDYFHRATLGPARGRISEKKDLQRDKKIIPMEGNYNDY